MFLWSCEMPYIITNIQWFIMSLVTHVLLSPPFLLTLIPYVPLEGFSLWVKPSQYYCNPWEDATREILKWLMTRVCLNYLTLLRHELLLYCLVVMMLCSPSGQHKKTEFWNLEYIKHTCPWNTAVLHDMWAGWAEPVACPHESPNFSTADFYCQAACQGWSVCASAIMNLWWTVSKNCCHSEDGSFRMPSVLHMP